MPRQLHATKGKAQYSLNIWVIRCTLLQILLLFFFIFLAQCIKLESAFFCKDVSSYLDAIDIVGWALFISLKLHFNTALSWLQI